MLFAESDGFNGAGHNVEQNAGKGNEKSTEIECGTC
jgi:hypothetical protein